MKWHLCAPAIARWGLGIVFFLFGILQFTSPESFYGYIPAFANNFGMSSATLILLNGILDFAIGVLLLLGIFTRIVAIVAAVHLLVIILGLGWNDITVRDIGLMIVAVAIAVHGSDELCLEKRWRSSRAR